MVSWTITVTDIETNKGVANAPVYLFIGGGGIVPPENADYSGTTDAYGAAVFDVPQGFYRVGIIAKDYESAHDPHNPPAEWKDVWTCWGAGGTIGIYDFEVKYVGVTPPPPPPSSSILQKALIVTAAIVSVCGVAYVITKRK